MYDDDRSRNSYGARSRDRDRDRDYDRDYGRDYDRGRSSYRRSSRSPRRERDEGDYDYYRSRNDDQDPLPYDDDQLDYRSRDRRLASRSPPARRHAPPPAQPSPTIIVQGLPGDATEDDVIDGFASVSPDLKVFNADNIKTVRLRNNGRGRTAGFVEFADANAAAHFLEFHYPSLDFQLAHSRGVNSEPVSVTINYSWSRDDEGYDRVREDRPRDTEDWKCVECAYMNYGSRTRCHKCLADKPGHRRTDESASYGPKLTGETDECPQQLPSQYIVIRGLEPSVTEEIFAEGVKKLYIESKPEPKKETHKKLKSTAPTARTASLGARPDSLRRVFLVRDKKTNDAMRYGFAEFATLEDAQGAIEKFKASPKFAVSSKPVTAAFIHTGVFIPHTGRVTDENSNFHFQPIYNRDILLKYWDNRVYPSILRVSYDSDAAKQHSVDNTVKSEKTGDEAINAQDASAKKLKRFKINQPAAKPAMVMGPQMQMWARKRAELVGQAQAQVELDANNNAASIPAPSEKGRGSSRTQAKDSYISYSDTDNLACLVCLRKFSSLVALRDHEALNKDHVANLLDEGKRDAAAERLRSQAKRPQVVTLRVANVSRQPSDLVYTSYADRDQLHCLICQRKFAKAAMLSLHERESEMHRLNLGDQGNIDRAISQLARIGKAPRKMVPAKNKGKRYRDRAKERRQAFKQPNAPRRKAPKKDAVPKEAEKPAAPSKGAALLGKMGWSAGEGLGAEGSGRTEVIATDVYASGVGLGAEGGRLGDAVEEAARKTKDNYTDFVEVTRKKARERYEKLG